MFIFLKSFFYLFTLIYKLMEYKFDSMNQIYLNQKYTFNNFCLNKNQGPIIKRLDSSFSRKNKNNHSKLNKTEYTYEYENKYENENFERISFFELEPNENSFNSSCNESNDDIIIFDIDDNNNNNNKENENEYEGLDELEIELFNHFKTKENDSIKGNKYNF